MANQPINPRYQQILQEDIPNITGHAERVLCKLMGRYARAHTVHVRNVMYASLRPLTSQLRAKMIMDFDRNDILHKIVQMRARFVKFRNFVNRPTVFYYPRQNGDNVMLVSEDYNAEWQGGQEPEEAREFRENGMPNYDELKYFFVTARAVLFWFEPQSNSVDNLPYRDSDNEDNGFSDVEEEVQEDDPSDEEE